MIEITWARSWNIRLDSLFSLNSPTDPCLLHGGTYQSYTGLGCQRLTDLTQRLVQLKPTRTSLESENGPRRKPSWVAQLVLGSLSLAAPTACIQFPNPLHFCPKPSSSVRGDTGAAFRQAVMEQFQYRLKLCIQTATAAPSQHRTVLSPCISGLFWYHKSLIFSLTAGFVPDLLLSELCRCDLRPLGSLLISSCSAAIFFS